MLTKDDLGKIGFFAFNKAKSENNAEMKELIKKLADIVSPLSDGEVFITSSDSEANEEENVFLSSQNLDIVIPYDDTFEDQSESYYSFEAARIGLVAMIDRQPENESHVKRLGKVEGDLSEVAKTINAMSFKKSADNIIDESKNVSAFVDVESVNKSVKALEEHLKEIKSNCESVGKSEFLALDLKKGNGQLLQ